MTGARFISTRPGPHELCIINRTDPSLREATRGRTDLRITGERKGKEKRRINEGGRNGREERAVRLR